MTDIYWFRSVPDVSMRIFNLFMIPLRKIRLRATRMKVHKENLAIPSSALTWLAGLLTMHFMSN